MADYYAIPTNIGEAKMANALALGIPIAITQLAVGDGEGNGAKGTPVPNPEANTLISERRRAPLNSFSVDPDNGNILIAEQVIPETAGGWWIREMGLFDEDGDMIFVCNTPPTYKPQLSEGSGRTQVVRMASIVSDTAAVTLKVDPSVVLATRKYAQELLSVHAEEFDKKINDRISYVRSVEELQAADAVIGACIATLGYLSPGDGGANDYEIVASGTGPEDGGSFINLNNGLQAKGLFSDGVVRSKQFGLVSDGLEDDAVQFLAAESFAKSLGKMLVMSPGTETYVSSATLSGKVLIGANKNAVIKGEILYDEPSFPVSANTTEPMNPSAPYFYCYGVDFIGPDSAAFGLTIRAPAQGSFIVSAAVEQCRFYGRNGLKAQNLITGEINSCQFFNTVIGEQLEGCTNFIHSNSIWHNQAAYGVNITEYAPDNSRLGGELISFVNCEWAVCSRGVKAYRSRWLRFNSCLIDFTGLPLHLEGCRNLDITGGNYFGASNTYQNLSSVVGYIAPPTNNVALYAVTSDDVGDAYITSGKISGTVLACYNDSATPLAIIDGTSAVTTYGCQNLMITGVTLLDNNVNTAPSLLDITFAKGIQITGNQFISPRTAAGHTPSGPYTLNNVTNYVSGNNNTSNFLDGSGNEVFAELDAPDFQNGVTNNQWLKFKNSSGVVGNVMIVNSADKVVVRAMPGSETIELQDSSGSAMARLAGGNVSVNISGVLKKLEEYTPDSAGTGYRAVRVTN